VDVCGCVCVCVCVGRWMCACVHVCMCIYMCVVCIKIIGGGQPSKAINGSWSGLWGLVQGSTGDWTDSSTCSLPRLLLGLGLRGLGLELLIGPGGGTFICDFCCCWVLLLRRSELPARSVSLGSLRGTGTVTARGVLGAVGAAEGARPRVLRVGIILPRLLSASYPFSLALS